MIGWSHLAGRHQPRPTNGRPPVEGGFVGGVEVLPFGLLVFVVGSLLIANTWAVVDAKLAVTDAAREAARSYVEQRDRATAEAQARAAAEDSMRGEGRDPGRLKLSDNRPAFVRCQVVVESAAYRVPAVTLPFIGGFGHGITVRASHREIIDPFTDGLSEVNSCGY